MNDELERKKITAQELAGLARENEDKLKKVRDLNDALDPKKE